MYCRLSKVSSSKGSSRTASWNAVRGPDGLKGLVAKTDETFLKN